MTTDRTPEPIAVIRLVEDYIHSELSDARKFGNRQPLDETGIWSLHALAAEIYAMGWRDGDMAAAERASQERGRERDAREEQGA